MYTHDYKQKMVDYFNDESKYRRLTYDPTEKIHSTETMKLPDTYLNKDTSINKQNGSY